MHGENTHFERVRELESQIYNGLARLANIVFQFDSYRL